MHRPVGLALVVGSLLVALLLRADILGQRELLDSDVPEHMQETRKTPRLALVAALLLT